MKAWTLLLPCIAVLAFACSTPAREKGPLSGFGFLAGTWAEVLPEEVREEVWVMNEGWSLVGTGRVLRDGRPVFEEKLAIEPRGKGFAYVAELPGAPPVEFELVERGEDWLRFENLRHDFPQRIEYRRDGDRLRAEVSGTTQSGPHSLVFDYRRVSGR